MYEREDGSIILEPDDLCFSCRNTSVCPLMGALESSVVIVAGDIAIERCQMFEARPALRVIEGGAGES